MIRTIIVDDEPLARARLRSLLRSDPEVELMALCSDGFEAISAIHQHKPDLVFLDVQMPEKDGFQVIKELKLERMPVFVFVTAFDQYALKAFEVAALDYLLKPFDEERFRLTLQRAKKMIREPRGKNEEYLLDFIRRWKDRPNYLEKFAVSADDRICLLPVEQIDYVEAKGNYVRIHVGKNGYLLRETLHSMEKQLDPSRFMRIHRSVIVNMEKIKQIQEMFHGAYRVILNDGRQLRLSRSYKDRLPRIAKREE